MCAYHGQEQVSSEDLVQLLEAVVQLKGEDSASPSLIAKTIMNFDIRAKVKRVVEASVTCILVLRNVAVRTSLKIYDSKVLIKLKKY